MEMWVGLREGVFFNIVSDEILSSAREELRKNCSAPTVG